MLFLFLYKGQANEPENLALRKPVTGNSGIGQGNCKLLTDGNTASNLYLGGPTQVQVDLEEVHTINVIKIWHYWQDGRTYHDNKVAVSEKKLSAKSDIVVFDSNIDGEYPETAEGKIIKFKPTKARYIFAWLGGNTVNPWAHWVEIQAFFIAEPVNAKGRVPHVWGRLKSRY